jgi:hypothetical protein
MPIKKRQGETKDEFITRCIPIEIKSGKNQEQSAAICYSYWDEKQLSAVKRIRNKKYKEKLSKFEKIRVGVLSSNVDKMMWNSETLELVIRFNDGSTYTYVGVDEKTFNDVSEGRAKPITTGENEYGSWQKGVGPSVGAAVHQYLIEKGVGFNPGGNFR